MPILFLLMCLCTWIAPTEAHAQFPIRLTATADRTQATPDDLVTMTAVVTNTTRDEVQEDITVWASFSEVVAYNSSSNSVPTGTAEFFPEEGTIIYTIPELAPGAEAILTLRIFGEVVGPVRTFFDFPDAQAPEITQEVDVEIFEIEADLGISIVSNTNSIVEGDLFGYQLVLTNAGPEQVSSASVAAEWPESANFISIAPTVPFSEVPNGIVFNTESIASGESQAFNIVIQPTQSGSGELVAEIGSDDAADPELSNNSATNVVNVGTPVSIDATITPITTQAFNPQTGLMEQTIRITNKETNTVDAIRLVIDSSEAIVYNVGGTNNNKGFVTLSRPLAPGESADLLFEYFTPTRTALSAPVLSAFSVPPAIGGTLPPGQGVKADLKYNLSAGTVLIEFVAAPGRLYEIVYSDDVTFTNTFRAAPAVVAPANRVQWIDHGPPKTSHLPGDLLKRFYRVIERAE